jgi:regulator of replication initiation timing
MTEIFTVQSVFNEVERLRAENKLLRLENERLKKLLAENASREKRWPPT